MAVVDADWSTHRQPLPVDFPSPDTALLKIMDAARKLLAQTTKPHLAISAAAREGEIGQEAKGLAVATTNTSEGSNSTVFRTLTDEWRTDTASLSGMDIEMHPAYLRIIRMGWPALPLILGDLERQGGHWFWALEAITGRNPANTAQNVREAREAWLRWGREHGLIE